MEIATVIEAGTVPIGYRGGNNGSTIVVMSKEHERMSIKITIVRGDKMPVF